MPDNRAHPAMGGASKVHSEDIGSRLRDRVVKPEVEFGVAWVGIAALATIGVLAVVYGREHEEESKRKKRSLQAQGR